VIIKTFLELSSWSFSHHRDNYRSYSNRINPGVLDPWHICH